MLSKHTKEVIRKRQVSRSWKQVKAAMITALVMVIVFIGYFVILDQLLKAKGL